jgi:hypothetical protein
MEHLLKSAYPYLTGFASFRAVPLQNNAKGAAPAPQNKFFTAPFTFLEHPVLFHQLIRRL